MDTWSAMNNDIDNNNNIPNFMVRDILHCLVFILQTYTAQVHQAQIVSASSN